MAAAEKRRRRTRADIVRAAFALAAAAALIAVVLLDLFWMRLDFSAASRQTPALAARGAGEMRVHFIDVGQGDCTVIEFPDGKVMMVDGGDGSSAATGGILAYCRALGVDTFDCILLTHPDTDHAGGLAAVIENFGAERIYMPYMPGVQAQAYRSFLDAAERSGAEIRISQLYEAVLSDEREQFYYAMILSPLSPLIESSYYTAANDASAVLYVEYAGRRLLMSGDASAAVEAQLAEDFIVTGGAVFAFEAKTAWGSQLLAPDLAGIDFLKAPHHGGAGSTGEALLELCRPRMYFVSAGAGNSYFHPAHAAIGRVLAAVPEAQIYRTDELGSIMLTVSAGGEATVTATGK